MAEAHRKRLAVTPAIRDLVARYPGRPGTPALRDLLDKGPAAFTRSQAERRFLAITRRAKLPGPAVNAHLGAFEVDFLWRDHRVAVEIDGYGFHSTRPTVAAIMRGTPS